MMLQLAVHNSFLRSELTAFRVWSRMRPISYLASYMVHKIATIHIYETFSAAMKSQEAALSIGVVHQ